MRSAAVGVGGERGWALVLVAAGLLGCGPGAATPRDASPGLDAPMDGPPPCLRPPKDSDGDSISDADESAAIKLDTDADGVFDYLDLDADGDGIPDAAEAGDDNLCTPPRDSDRDGVPDFRDSDSDGNGMPDAVEGGGDRDRDGIVDADDPDDDNDTILDVDELDRNSADVDTNRDGVPDRFDEDSDGDRVPDIVELNNDPDGDGVPSQRDLDSDGDCISDTVEAGDDPRNPVNADGDGTPDFLDFDSDNDGLPDQQEDLNCNGRLDPGESDRHRPDTDGDGYPDVVERAAGKDPADPDSKLDPEDFFFVLPYHDPAQEKPLDFQTGIVKADLSFNVDTTGSMEPVEERLQRTLISRILPAAVRVVPNLDTCASSFQDFPVPPFGAAECSGRGDLPFRLHQRCSSAVQRTADAIDQYNKPQGCGGDAPESGYEALYQTATGEGISGPWGSVPKFDPEAGFDPTLDMGPIGGVGFRLGALPIVVHVTDVGSHDQNEYGGLNVLSHSKMEALQALKAIGARVIGVAVGEGPIPYLTELARETGAIVPPLEAFPSGGGGCLTGLGGRQKPPDAKGLCPLVFEINGDGTGLAEVIVDAIRAVAFFAAIDISGRPLGDPDKLPALDTADFIKAITPVPPAPAGAVIASDTFRHVRPGSPVRFSVGAHNDFLRPTRVPQLFQLTIQVLGDLVTLLDSRRVFIIVPPVIGPS